MEIVFSSSDRSDVRIYRIYILEILKSPVEIVLILYEMNQIQGMYCKKKYKLVHFYFDLLFLEINRQFIRIDYKILFRFQLRIKVTFLQISHPIYCLPPRFNGYIVRRVSTRYCVQTSVSSPLE